MNMFNYSLRCKINSSIFSSVKRSSTLCYNISVIHNKHTFLFTKQSSVQLLSDRCFMKKAMGLKPVYDSYDKKASKDRVSPTEYELIYHGTGETYVRYLSGITVGAMIILPTVFISTYVYILFSHGEIDMKTFLEFMLLPNSSLEIMIMVPTLFLLKFASFSFISKFVLRIYKHNSKSEYICVYVNPFLPWNNITCKFDRAFKLPDSKLIFVPWYREYHKLAGYKSIVLKEKFRRPVDYDRMIGTEKTIDE